MSDAYLVKPVYKALELLKALGEAGGEKSLAEMAVITGIPKSTAFKYLRTLRECGYVAHDSRTDRYRIGLVVWRLGQLAGEQWAVQHVAHPFLEQLRERFDETANLGILDGTDIVYLDIVESRRSLRMRASLGGRHPAYSTALGKAMLAFAPGETWRTHVPEQLSPRTSRTLTSADELHEELQIISRRGYALDRGENEDGACCIATPILGAKGKVVGAISVSAPAIRVTRPVQQEIVQTLLAVGADASERMGHVAPTPVAAGSE